MKYIFSQSCGDTTRLAIVENPRVENGTVYATQVGEFNGWIDHKEVFKACKPIQFIAGGGPWIMTSFEGILH